jgi:hypothetical protein
LVDGAKGWDFTPGDGVILDSVNGKFRLSEIYILAEPTYSGRVTVPVLWDRERRTIVNNESSEIIRMLNSAFDGVGASPGDYYPAPLRADIDALNRRIYDTVNDGVYKAGFATTQQAYEAAVVALFETLDWRNIGESRSLGAAPTRPTGGCSPLVVRSHLSGISNASAPLRLSNLGLYARFYHDESCQRRRLTHQTPLLRATGRSTDRIVPLGPIVDFRRRTTRWSLRTQYPKAVSVLAFRHAPCVDGCEALR